MKRYILTIMTFLWTAGCAIPVVNKGIEIGNPTPEVPIRIVPSNSMDSYEIAPTEFGNARITRFRSVEQSSQEVGSVVVPYQVTGVLFEINAIFPDGRRFSTSVNLSQDPDIDGTLYVDGHQVAACFELVGITSECPPPVFVYNNPLPAQVSVYKGGSKPGDSPIKGGLQPDVLTNGVQHPSLEDEDCQDSDRLCRIPHIDIRFPDEGEDDADMAQEPAVREMP